MKNAFQIFKYKQIPVYIKYWFLLLLLFVPPVEMISLFIGILVHELSHALEAKKLGYKTDYVFIDVLYGGALVDSNHKYNNLHAIKIALAGPLSNLVLAGIGFLATSLIYFQFGEIKMMEYTSIFTLINLLLGAFNLLPIYPLDGGRISKGILNLFYNRKKSRRINSIISLFTLVIVIILSIYYQLWITLIFSLIFLIVAYTEWQKD